MINTDELLERLKQVYSNMREEDSFNVKNDYRFKDVKSNPIYVSKGTVGYFISAIPTYNKVDDYVEYVDYLSRHIYNQMFGITKEIILERMELLLDRMDDTIKYQIYNFGDEALFASKVDIRRWIIELKKEEPNISIKRIMVYCNEIWKEI